MSVWDKELAPQLQKLPEQDRAMVAKYLMRAKLGEVFGGKGVPIGTTVGQAIEEQKKFETAEAVARAEEEALRKKLEEERATAIARLNRAVTVTLLQKRELGPDYDARRYSETQVIKVGVKNESDKPIIGVAGALRFVDVFDKEVGGVTFSISERIEPGKSVVWGGERRYNQYIDEHRAVWNLEEGKYTTRFVPETIVFADGSKLAAPR
jgi:hypothetical protein